MAKTTNNKTVTEISPAEFKKIPLEFIIATPLLTTIEAHRVAANTTLKFIKELSDAEPMKFELQLNETTGNTTDIANKTIKVPLLSMVHIPNMNFDSLSVTFNYSISQIYTEKKEKEGSAEGEISTTGLLSKFVGASFGGSIESRTSSELTSNRSGSLEIKIHASEGDMPQGLSKIVTAIANSIDAQIV